MLITLYEVIPMHTSSMSKYIHTDTRVMLLLHTMLVAWYHLTKGGGNVILSSIWTKGCHPWLYPIHPTHCLVGVYGSTIIFFANSCLLGQDGFVWLYIQQSFQYVVLWRYIIEPGDHVA